MKSNNVVFACVVIEHGKHCAVLGEFRPPALHIVHEESPQRSGAAPAGINNDETDGIDALNGLSIGVVGHSQSQQVPYVRSGISFPGSKSRLSDDY